jgi:hypothetical protein
VEERGTAPPRGRGEHTKKQLIQIIYDKFPEFLERTSWNSLWEDFWLAHR